VQGAFDNVTQVQRLVLQAHRATTHALDSEKVIDKARQMTDLALAHFTGLPGFFRRRH
jgi:hypothetical protein